MESINLTSVVQSLEVNGMVQQCYTINHEGNKKIRWGKAEELEFYYVEFQMMVEYIGGHVLQQLKIRNCSGLTAQFYSSCPDLSPEFQYYHIPTTHLTLAPAVYISRNRTHCLNSLSWLVPLSMLFIHWKNIYCHSSQKLKIHLHLLLLPH